LRGIKISDLGVPKEITQQSKNTEFRFTRLPNFEHACDKLKGITTCQDACPGKIISFGIVEYSKNLIKGIAYNERKVFAAQLY
jgi:hypothetical protein